MKALILIPARYASTRFPGKPLADINGKPMIQYVVEKAKAVSDDVWVATDDERILKAVEAFGGNAVLTSDKHRSGTDRCQEAYAKITAVQPNHYDVIVNLQGDEPFIEPSQIEQLIDCFMDTNIQIATLCKKFPQDGDIQNPNKVKVVMSALGTALYFSRFPIPYCRGTEPTEWTKKQSYYKHVGMYAYRPNVLGEITKLSAGKLETAESLEQLRWLENGYTIAVRETMHESIGIDTPDDLEQAKRLL